MLPFIYEKRSSCTILIEMLGHSQLNRQIIFLPLNSSNKICGCSPQCEVKLACYCRKHIQCSASSLQQLQSQTFEHVVSTKQVSERRTVCFADRICLLAILLYQLAPETKLNSQTLETDFTALLFYYYFQVYFGEIILRGFFYILTIKLCHNNSLVQEKSVRFSLDNFSAVSSSPRIKSMRTGCLPLWINRIKLNMSPTI